MLTETPIAAGSSMTAESAMIPGPVMSIKTSVEAGAVRAVEMPAVIELSETASPDETGAEPPGGGIPPCGGKEPPVGPVPPAGSIPAGAIDDPAIDSGVIFLVVIAIFRIGRVAHPRIVHAGRLSGVVVICALFVREDDPPGIGYALGAIDRLRI